MVASGAESADASGANSEERDVYCGGGDSAGARAVYGAGRSRAGIGGVDGGAAKCRVGAMRLATGGSVQRGLSC